MKFRRRFSRFKPDEHEMTLRLASGEVLPCEVQNESYGGLGVVVDDGSSLEEGQELEVALEGSAFEAVVTSIRKLSDGGYFVGLKWLEASEDDDSEGFDADD